MPAVRKNKERDNSNSTYNLVMKVNEDYDVKGNRRRDQMENIIDVRLDVRNNDLSTCPALLVSAQYAYSTNNWVIR